MKQKTALVVGAGFAGAVVARELAEAGWKVQVIDQRDHVAGNAFDYVNEHGIRVHRYGPHLWHTSNDEAHEWVSRFTEWLPYTHSVKALLPNGTYTPLPINNQTIEDVFGVEFETWAIDNGYVDRLVCTNTERYLPEAHTEFLSTLIPKVDPEDGDGVENSYEHVVLSVGEKLTNLFFAPYTKKMWGLDLEQLPASVAARIPTSVGSYDERYFPKDTHQFLPRDGYTALFERIFDHPNIKVALNIDHKQVRSLYSRSEPFDATFTSEPIDTYYGCDLGELPWRSVKMHVHTLPLPQALPASVVNFTHAGPHTRVTEWKQLPGHGSNDTVTTLTFEEPCDYRANNMERYYPVKTADRQDPNRALYQQYKQRAEKEGIHFIGRCGMYVYQDMHAVISTTMAIVKKFLKAQPEC